MTTMMAEALMTKRLHVTILLYTLFTILWIVVFAPVVDFLFPSNVVRQLFGRYYSINNTRHVEMLEFITLQAAIAIDGIERYYENNGRYPDTIDNLIIEKYPKYIPDTFRSEYRNISFPCFSYARHVDEDAVENSEFFTIMASFGKDYLLYDNRHNQWRFFQKGQSPSGYVLPSEF